MGIMRFNYRSQAVGGYMDITVVYPTDRYSYYDQTKGMRHHVARGQQPLPQYVPGMKFQTVYLIHGGGDDDTLTYRYTNAELYAQRNNVMLVTPSIMNSFGVDTNFGIAYSTFLTEELPMVIQTLFASSPAREDNFIMGYAMGGNAALGNAIMHPELYAECIDISGGIGLTLNTQKFKKELSDDHFKGFPLFGSTFGKAEDLENSRHDMYAISKKNIASGVPLPKFTLIAGAEEGRIKDRVKDDAMTMKELGYDVTYIEVPERKHYFDFWDECIAKALDELLPLKREAIYPEK